jgi:hypothetical protein
MGLLGVNLLWAIRSSLNPMTSFLKRGRLSPPFFCDPKLDQFPQQFRYKNFYGVSKVPFHPQPDLLLIFLTENVREVWNSILSGIAQGKRFLLLTGERGIGKTTLISLINLYLATNGRHVKVIPPSDSPQKIEHILQPLLSGLGLSPMEKSKSQMLFRLEGALAEGTASVVLQYYLYNNPISCYKWVHVEPSRKIVDNGRGAQNPESLGGR